VVKILAVDIVLKCGSSSGDRIHRNCRPRTMQILTTAATNRAEQASSTNNDTIHEIPRFAEHIR
jgi:hypothetical protein